MTYNENGLWKINLVYGKYKKITGATEQTNSEENIYSDEVEIEEKIFWVSLSTQYRIKK